MLHTMEFAQVRLPGHATDVVVQPEPSLLQTPLYLFVLVLQTGMQAVHALPQNVFVLHRAHIVSPSFTQYSSGAHVAVLHGDVVHEHCVAHTFPLQPRLLPQFALFDVHELKSGPTHEYVVAVPLEQLGVLQPLGAIEFMPQHVPDTHTLLSQSPLTEHDSPAVFFM